MSLNDIIRQIFWWTRIRRYLFALNLVLMVLAIAINGWVLLLVIITVPSYVIAQRVTETWRDEYEMRIAEMSEK